METSIAAGGDRRVLWTGRVLSALPVLLMVTSGTFKLVGGLTGNPELLRSWTSFGYPPAALLPIGALEVACAIVYAIPRTAVIGAVLVTGYLGGAVATHVRLSQGVWFAPAVLGALAWLGRYLRDPRIRALLPLRGGR